MCEKKLALLINMGKMLTTIYSRLFIETCSYATEAFK